MCLLILPASSSSPSGSTAAPVRSTTGSVYSSSSSRKRQVLQQTRLNRANTSGNVIREMTSMRFDREHFLCVQRGRMTRKKRSVQDQNFETGLGQRKVQRKFLRKKKNQAIGKLTGALILSVFFFCLGGSNFANHNENWQHCS